MPTLDDLRDVLVAREVYAGDPESVLARLSHDRLNVRRARRAGSPWLAIGAVAALMLALTVMLVVVRSTDRSSPALAALPDDSIWRLASVNGHPYSPQGQDYELLYVEGPNVAGLTTCTGTISGTRSQLNHTITFAFTQVVSGCDPGFRPPVLIDQADEMLAGTVHWTVTGETLTLRTASGGTVTFTRDRNLSAPGHVTVPDLQLKPLQVAQGLIASARLTLVTNLNGPCPSGTAPGPAYVANQAPGPGTVVTPGSIVRVHLCGR